MKKLLKALFWIGVVILVVVLLLTEPTERRPLMARMIVSVVGTVGDVADRIVDWAKQWGGLKSPGAKVDAPSAGYRALEWLDRETAAEVNRGRKPVPLSNVPRKHRGFTTQGE